MLEPSIDLPRIAAHGGSQQDAFEEFVCQLARRVAGIPAGSRFQRNGRGADLGVECLWHLPDGAKRGWQAKFVHDVSALRSQVTESIESAVAGHPELTEYVVCFPFTPSDAPGRGGTSQATRLENYRQDWEEYAAGEGVILTVTYWNASELSTRLLEIDPHGGRRRYWFGDDLLTRSWFDAQTRAAHSIAGPRYTPELRVEDGLGRLFAGLGATSEWDALVSAQRESIEKARNDWADSLRTGRADQSFPIFPDETRPAADSLRATLDNLFDLFDAIVRTSDREELKAAVDAAIQQATQIRTELAGRIEQEHGDGTSSSEAFRQYRIEHMVEFTLIHLERADAVVSVLTELRAWLDSAEVGAASSRTLLVTGSAGTGKTHAVCDEAARRVQRSQLALVVFGERFRSDTVWAGLKSQLGLSAEWSLDGFFDALDSAAEASGDRLLLMVDAINETTPRSFWRTELPALLDALRQREHLGLCLTCRSPFLETTVPSNLDLPRFEHQGFSGREFDACSTFFSHYDLDPPVGPLLLPEFSNPLVLKLTCEALVASGLRALPRGWKGFRDAIAARIRSVDSSFAEEYGPAITGEAAAALDRIVLQMAAQGSRSLVRRECVSAIGDAAIPALALLTRLVEEEILHLLPGDEPPGMLAAAEDRVAFSYERIGDHLIVQAQLRQSDDPDDVRDLVRRTTNEAGLFEALAVQVPEHIDTEVLDLLEEDEITNDVLQRWSSALSWRTSDSLLKTTGRWLFEAMKRAESFWLATEAMLHLAVRPSHRLDARWMHRMLGTRPLAERDAFWCPYLYRAYDEKDACPGSPTVVRLIETAWNPRVVENVDAEVAINWLTVLCWFFAASDRRVRDRSTRAALRISENRVAIWPSVLERLDGVDDDYVLERAYLVCYGTLLRRTDDEALGRIAEHAAAQILETTNALLRDHCRAICELAERRGVLPDSVDAYQPPYQSDWPPTIPSEADLEVYRTDENRGRYPRLTQSVLSPMGDFANYTVKPVLRPYAHQVSFESVCRWIFQTVLDLGYAPELHAGFDHHLLREHGGGRSRPGWADRIGKKYQNIALARTLGTVADQIAPEREYEWDPEPSTSGLVALALRDLDPTTTQPAPDDDTPHCWSGIEYAPSSTNPEDDDAWAADEREMRLLEDKFWELSIQSEPFLPLEAYPKWIDKDVRQDDAGFRRQVWMQIRSYVVPKRGFDRTWRWLRSLSTDDIWRLPTGRHIYERLFLAEYPWATASRDASVADAEARLGAPHPLLPTAHLLGPELEGDCSGVGNRSVYVPVPQLLDGLVWNDAGGFESSSGEVIFTSPSFTVPGVSGCFFSRPHFEEWLDARAMSLIWTVVGERLPGTYRTVERLVYGHVRALHSGRLRSAKHSITTRR